MSVTEFVAGGAGQEDPTDNDDTAIHGVGVLQTRRGVSRHLQPLWQALTFMINTSHSANRARDAAHEVDKRQAVMEVRQSALEEQLKRDDEREERAHRERVAAAKLKTAEAEKAAAEARLRTEELRVERMRLDALVQRVVAATQAGKEVAVAPGPVPAGLLGQPPRSWCSGRVCKGVFAACAVLAMLFVLVAAVADTRRARYYG